MLRDCSARSSVGSAVSTFPRLSRNSASNMSVRRVVKRCSTRSAKSFARLFLMLGSKVTPIGVATATCAASNSLPLTLSPSPVRPCDLQNGSLDALEKVAVAKEHARGFKHSLAYIGTGRQACPCVNARGRRCCGAPCAIRRARHDGVRPARGQGGGQQGGDGAGPGGRPPTGPR